MLGVNLLKLAHDPDAPAFTSDQIPDDSVLRQEALGVTAIYNNMKLVEASDVSGLDTTPTSSDEQAMNAMIAAMIALVPEVAQYTNMDPLLFTNIHQLDLKLAQTEQVNAGLQDDCAGAALTVAAEATQDCDQALNASETLLSDPATPLATALQIDEQFFAAVATIADAQKQLQARRQRDALRAAQRAKLLAQQQAQVSTQAALPGLRGTKVDATATSAAKKKTKATKKKSS